ncbi:MAG: 23S rRNA (adenine(2503)-C(2))-methyltransferase RlmN [Enterococcaceae bacterium]|jgi:23S rRNA (adenine2503-C2)-methyltransferase|nr:23S rRNA (adenine(2503)-C(2))-methyltransferase RlmN [Enterococcaceae bacterium]MCI1918554.1 23S rRNA (adenine(2503)-C(2))-methyltransferase RlmN [Enterococcaceae bacterium]
MTKEDLITWLAERGEKKFRATQIWDWLYIKRVASFAEMTNLKKELAAMLEENFVLETLKPLVVQEASDGTTKYLFELEDKNLIETVLMRQEYGLSLCVTTQLGCNMGCSFCASGLLKKSRDLTAGEITAQVMEVQRFLDKKEERLSHVVVMGIGEPFDNYENVMKFVRIINDQKGLAIGARHITVSTCGVVPKIREFAREGLQVNLALSLHAPNEELRSRLMKVNRTFTLAKIMDAIGDYLDQTDRRVTFEYIMLHGVNDQIAQARELAELLQDHKKLAYVNLIPYNPVSEHDQYQRSEQQDVLRFYDYLKKHGINCVIRQEHGTDIDAACGQLRSKQLGVL